MQFLKPRGGLGIFVCLRVFCFFWFFFVAAQVAIRFVHWGDGGSRTSCVCLQELQDSAVLK